MIGVSPREKCPAQEKSCKNDQNSWTNEKMRTAAGKGVAFSMNLRLAMQASWEARLSLSRAIVGMLHACVHAWLRFCVSVWAPALPLSASLPLCLSASLCFSSLCLLACCSSCVSVFPSVSADEFLPVWRCAHLLVLDSFSLSTNCGLSLCVCCLLACSAWACL